MHSPPFPIGGMQQRVQCRRCAAHRDLALAPRCLVCGVESFERVLPTAGDLTAVTAVDAITLELVECAEQLDAVIQDGGTFLDRTHPLAMRLAQACRARALTQAQLLDRRAEFTG